MWKSRNTDYARNDRSLPDRESPIEISGRHFVTGAAITPPFPEGSETVLFGMGCFWGAERKFWLTDGVVATAVGYAGGTTKNPSYEDVCSGRTGHTEAVLVVFDPKIVSFGALLKRFWEAHDPTQGMRQGPDRGTQYRSAIYTTTAAQQTEALISRDRYGADLAAAGFGEITTEIQPATGFFYAEEYHQQYLARNLARSGIDPEEFYFGEVEPPAHPIAAEGYCGMQPTGVACPIGLHVDGRDTTTTT
jgi:peptide-methionine (S)-S-oxide reductase